MLLRRRECECRSRDSRRFFTIAEDHDCFKIFLCDCMHMREHRIALFFFLFVEEKKTLFLHARARESLPDPCFFYMYMSRVFGYIHHLKQTT